MNAKLKAKWVAALRSGEYKQCRQVLHSIATDSFCCMGVLAVVSGEITDRAKLADGVFEWATLCGMDSDDSTDLASMNDAGKSFDDIANHIEANL